MTDADLNDLVAWVRTQGTGGVVGQAREMRKPQEAISGTLAALRSIASSLIDPSGPRRAPGGKHVSPHWAHRGAGSFRTSN